MSDFTSSAFWQSADTHVACAPHECADGLREFMEGTLGRQGWCLFQTSGTEGVRKWVALTKRALLLSARTVNAHYGITTADHWLLALPLWHVGGFGIVARAFASGSRVTAFDGKWDARRFACMAVETGASLSSLVPAQVIDLVAAKIDAPKAMRVVLVGGGALSAEVEREALRLGWPVRRTYGMTETCSQVASQAVEGGELDVLPIWSLATDADGILTVRGEALACGYAVPEVGNWRWEPILAENGLRTRDRVVLGHEDGRTWLRFEGRAAGTVKVLGELVALGPIQERIEALRLKLGLHDGDAAIVDVPDTRREARLVLATSALDASAVDKLCAALNATLRAFEQVEHVGLKQAVPRGELGKVRLEVLRAMVTAENKTA